LKLKDRQLGPAPMTFERKALCGAHSNVTRASHRAIREMPTEDAIWKDTKLRSSKYVNHMIEQDHRGVKSRIVSMLGFKSFKRGGYHCRH
jgi:hypothetical protein